MSVKYLGIAASSIKKSAAHTHPYTEIVVNIEGTGITQIGNYTYPFKKGTICFIPPNCNHSKISESGFKDIYLTTDKLNINIEDKPLFTEDDENSSIEKLFSLMLRTYLKKEYNYHLVVDSLWEATEQLIISHLNKDKPANHSIELFMDDVIMNYTNCEFKVIHAVNKTNYCYDHFRRIFKEYKNMTPNQFLIDLRIRCAKKLLTNSEKKSIKEIAEESGFSDVLYFHKVFKKETGITPAEYAESKKE